MRYCIEARPGTMGEQLCWRKPRHAGAHRQQDGQRWQADTVSLWETPGGLSRTGAPDPGTGWDIEAAQAARGEVLSWIDGKSWLNGAHVSVLKALVSLTPDCEFLDFRIAVLAPIEAVRGEARLGERVFMETLLGLEEELGLNTACPAAGLVFPDQGDWVFRVVHPLADLSPVAAGWLWQETCDLPCMPAPAPLPPADGGGWS